MDFAVISLAFLTAAKGFYVLRSKSGNECLLEALSLSNTILASILALLLENKLMELISHVRHVDAFGPDHTWKFWAWWCFILGSVVILQAATVIAISGIKFYREQQELVIDRWNTEKTSAKELTLLELYAAIQIALGIVMILVDVTGAALGPAGGTLKTNQIYWYASITVFIIGGLVMASGVLGVVVSRQSVAVKRQFDAITTINYAVIALSSLVFALFVITTAILVMFFLKEIYNKELWHFLTEVGSAKLVTLFAIFILSIKTSRLTSMRVQLFITSLDDIEQGMQKQNNII
ncbi:uncharacterized protein LOC129594800 isoform X2 [Paramacrobiotus metropolitanus]|nr:uncharacterized protein LOC129594800 isoform X2 [Paramacrobiotus metropolitanus]